MCPGEPYPDGRRGFPSIKDTSTTTQTHAYRTLCRKPYLNDRRPYPPAWAGYGLFLLSAFLFAFSVRQLRSCLSSLADGAFQVFGQLEYFNQRDELLFGELVIINTERSKERPDLLFLGTALKVHRILQLTLHGCNKGCFIPSR